MKERCVGASKHHLHDSPRAPAPMLKQSAALKLPPFSHFVPPVKSELFLSSPPPITPPHLHPRSWPFLLVGHYFFLIAHLSLSHLGCLCVLAEKEPSCVQRLSSWCPRLCFAFFFTREQRRKKLDGKVAEREREVIERHIDFCQWNSVALGWNQTWKALKTKEWDMNFQLPSPTAVAHCKQEQRPCV